MESYIRVHQVYDFRKGVAGMSEILDYEEAIRPSFRKKRYHHSLCVAEAAEELARQYGADEEKAWIAGFCTIFSKRRRERSS